MEDANKINLETDYEGSWALLMEELTYKGHVRNQWGMAGLRVSKCATYGKQRYYVFCMSKEDVINNQERFYEFLTNEEKVNNCVSEMQDILDHFETQKWEAGDVNECFKSYCDSVERYLGFYNEVFSDLWYGRAYEIIRNGIPAKWHFAERFLMEALLVTDNRNLLSYSAQEDLIRLKSLQGNKEQFAREMENYVEKYKSIKKASSFEETDLSKTVLREMRSLSNIDAQILKNARLRNQYANRWSERAADLLEFSPEKKTAISSIRKLSYIKLKMREGFQVYKEKAKQAFLDGIIRDIGKPEYDYMFSAEILLFLQYGKRVDSFVLDARRKGICIEYVNGEVKFTQGVAEDLKSLSKTDCREARGSVLIGRGVSRYMVYKYVQNNEAIAELEKLNKFSDKSQIVVVTNTLRPYMMSWLKGIGAIITKQGGFTSHAAVLCREMGIKSIMGASMAMDLFRTGDIVDVNFDIGSITYVSNAIGCGERLEKPHAERMIDIPNPCTLSMRDVGNKAANLNELSKVAEIPKGFAISRNSYELLNERSFRREVLEKIATLKSDLVAIRSSHESEDGKNSSFAGLFKSFVNIDARDEEKVIGYIKGVFDSCNTDSIRLYNGALGEGMHVLIQEMIRADVTGVILSSRVNKGYEYMLVEYTSGDLADVMDGTVTPFSMYVPKASAFENDYCFIPPLLIESYERSFRELVSMALKIEEQFGGPVEIEWGIKDSKVIIFQARLI